jgi:hypothetical protein
LTIKEISNLEQLNILISEGIKENYNEISFLEKSISMFGPLTYKIQAMSGVNIISEITLIPQLLKSKIYFALSNWKSDSNFSGMGTLPLMYTKKIESPKYVFGVSKLANEIYTKLGYSKVQNLQHYVIINRIPKSLLSTSVLKKIPKPITSAIVVFTNLIIQIFNKIIGIVNRDTLILDLTSEGSKKFFCKFENDEFISEFESYEYELLSSNILSQSFLLENRYLKLVIKSEVVYVWIQIKSGNSMTSLSLKNFKSLRIRSCSIDADSENLYLKWKIMMSLKEYAESENCNVIEFISHKNNWNIKDLIFGQIIKINSDFGLFTERAMDKLIFEKIVSKKMFITLGDAYLA